MKFLLNLAHASLISSEKAKNLSNNRDSSGRSWKLNTKKLKVEAPSTSKQANAADAAHSSTPYSGTYSKKGNIQNIFRNMKSFEEGGPKYTQLTNSILFMFCKDSQAITAVERESFKELIKDLAPNYKISCRKPFAKRLEEKYIKVSANYKKIFKNFNNITLTTDIWTDAFNSRSFLGLPAHYLIGLKMETVVFGVDEVPVAHTSKNIKNKLHQMCEEWEINTNQISTIVTDNASNIVKAAKDLIGEASHSTRKN